MTTNIVQFGRIYKEDLALGKGNSNVTLADGSTVLMHEIDLTGDVVNVRDYGAVGDGVTDDRTAIQAAIDAFPAGSVHFPYTTTGYYVASALNLTNSYVKLIGGNGLTTIISGSSDYIADCTSWNNGVMRDIGFTSTTAKIGLFFSRSSTNGYAQFNKLDNVRITLSHNVSVNGGRGTIGIYNRAAELLTCEETDIVADTPLVMCASAEVGYDSLFTTVGGADSMTTAQFRRVSFRSNTNDTYAMMLYDVAGIDFDNCYWQYQTSSGTNPYCIYGDTVVNCRFTGNVESWGQFMRSVAITRNSRFQLSISLGNTDGCINLVKVGSDTPLFTNNELLIDLIGSPPAGASVVRCAETFPDFGIKGNIINAGTHPNVVPISFTDATGYLAGAVVNNVEIGYNSLIVNNKRDRFVLGAYVGNATSLTYTIPDGVGWVEITASYLTNIASSADYHTYKWILTRWKGSNVRFSEVSLGSSGTLNTITATLNAGTIVFAAANNVAGEYIGYKFEEYYGDTD